MNQFIPEEFYLKIIKHVPIFCIDFLIRCKENYLLVKRNEEPLKNVYWLVGGRLIYKETIDECVQRILQREIGRKFTNYKMISFSNYIFSNNKNSRAIHTPTILFEIEVEEEFKPSLDNTHSKYIWSKTLPDEFKKNLNLFKESSLTY